MPAPVTITPTPAIVYTTVRFSEAQLVSRSQTEGFSTGTATVARGGTLGGAAEAPDMFKQDILVYLSS